MDITEQKVKQQLAIDKNKELAAQNKLIEKRAAELVIANKELIYQSAEKEKRAAELAIANIERAIEKEEKEKLITDLKIAGIKAKVNEEKALLNEELILANKEMSFHIFEKELLTDRLIIAKEKAKESDRLKSAFLANVSHEIRTPMNGILGFAELLKEPDLTGDEQQKYIAIIEKGGERMLNIINDIISISKIESGQMEVHISETNINEQIEFINAFFKAVVEQKGITFSVKKSCL